MTIPLSEIAERWLEEPAFRENYDALEIPIALEFARTRAGLTQHELAKRMGTTQSAIARLERSGSEPSVRTLRRWAKATSTRLSIALVPLSSVPSKLP